MPSPPLSSVVDDELSVRNSLVEFLEDCQFLFIPLVALSRSEIRSSV
jgi:FixJ family two-component response regulator